MNQRPCKIFWSVLAALDGGKARAERKTAISSSLQNNELAVEARNQVSARRVGGVASPPSPSFRRGRRAHQQTLPLSRFAKTPKLSRNQANDQQQTTQRASSPGSCCEGKKTDEKELKSCRSEDLGAIKNCAPRAAEADRPSTTATMCNAAVVWWSHLFVCRCAGTRSVKEC